MKIIVIIKIESNYLHIAYPYVILETFIPIDNNPYRSKKVETSLLIPYKVRSLHFS